MHNPLLFDEIGVQLSDNFCQGYPLAPNQKKDAFCGIPGIKKADEHWHPIHEIYKHYDADTRQGTTVNNFARYCESVSLGKERHPLYHNKGLSRIVLAHPEDIQLKLDPKTNLALLHIHDRLYDAIVSHLEQARDARKGFRN